MKKTKTLTFNHRGLDFVRQWKGEWEVTGHIDWFSIYHSPEWHKVEILPPTSFHYRQNEHYYLAGLEVPYSLRIEMSYRPKYDTYKIRWFNGWNVTFLPSSGHAKAVPIPIPDCVEESLATPYFEQQLIDLVQDTERELHRLKYGV